MDKDEWVRFHSMSWRYIHTCMYNKKLWLSILLLGVSVLLYLVQFSFFSVTSRLNSYSILKWRFVKTWNMRSPCFIDSLRITPDYESIMKQIKCLLGWIITFPFLIMDKNEWFRFSFILWRYIRACMYNKKFLLSILLERMSVLVYLVHFSFLFW